MEKFARAACYALVVYVVVLILNPLFDERVEPIPIVIFGFFAFVAGFGQGFKRGLEEARAVLGS